MSVASVKRGLTADSRSGRARYRQAVVENDDFAAFARRIVAAHGRRIAAGDIEGLAELAALATHVDGAMTDAVTGLRAAGISWADIAHRLSVTRQAVHQRFGSVRAVADTEGP